MAWSLAKVRPVIPVTFLGRDDDDVFVHHMRGTDADEWGELTAAYQRATVTGDDEDTAAARGAVRDAYFDLWSALIERVEGYEGAEGLEGKALRAYFRGEGEAFKGADAAMLRIARAELEAHISQAVDLYAIEQRLDRSFRVAAGSRDGARARGVETAS